MNMHIAGTGLLTCVSDFRLAADTPGILLACYRRMLPPFQRMGVLSNDERGTFATLAHEAMRQLRLSEEYPVMLAAFLNEADRVGGATFQAQRFFGGDAMRYGTQHAFWIFQFHEREYALKHINQQFFARCERWADNAHRELRLSVDASLGFALHHFSVSDNEGRKWTETLFTLTELPWDVW